MLQLAPVLNTFSYLSRMAILLFRILPVSIRNSDSLVRRTEPIERICIQRLEVAIDLPFDHREAVFVVHRRTAVDLARAEVVDRREDDDLDRPAAEVVGHRTEAVGDRRDEEVVDRREREVCDRRAAVVVRR